MHKLFEENARIPAPLYEDPIYGGPSDPCVIWNETEREWWMFYTQRRACGFQTGVSAVHGTGIGIASSPDGEKWLYRGLAEGLRVDWGHNTFWAPEVVWAEGCYHMFVSYIRGVPSDWTGKASIIHFVSDNLWSWTYSDTPDLHSDRVIDACLFWTPDGIYKMWYKDEQRNSHSCAAVSRDLKQWEVLGEEITDCPHEGPNVFALGGTYWMITDTWNGMGVYRSEDLTHWTRQEGNILTGAGTRPMDCEMGNHGDVVCCGEEGYLFYFVHPYFPASLRSDPSFAPGERESHTVIQCARLYVRDGRLVVGSDPITESLQ